jgi:hypothetical protein
VVEVVVALGSVPKIRITEKHLYRRGNSCSSANAHPTKDPKERTAKIYCEV